MELCGALSSRNSLPHVQGWRQGPAGAAHSPSKRRRAESPNRTAERSHFVQLDGHRGVYYSESWEANGSTLYLPVRGIVLVNMHKYEQISFEHGCFCIGDETGGFQQRVQGQALHCWRYSNEEKKLFIALSYFFTNGDVFQDVLGSLECL